MRATGFVQDGCVVDRDEPAVRHSLDEVRLLAPVQPRKFLAIGLNYADHIAESGMEAPQYPVFFNKQVTCVVGPDDEYTCRGSPSCWTTRASWRS